MKKSVSDACVHSQPEIELVLASQSPRRKDLLSQQGVVFTVQPADIDETQMKNETAMGYVKRMAIEKARKVQKHYCEAAILSADTIVCQGDAIFGKPIDFTHAVKIWSQLNNSEHQVITAVSLLTYDSLHTMLSKTKVTFSRITEKQMKSYWQTGESADKAGAYAIQGLASAWVKKIEGSYSNVVGLPLFETNQLLKNISKHWM